MKAILRLALIGLASLVLLTGCLFPTTDNQLSVTVNPSSGHPPFAVTVTAQDKGGGTYTFEATGEAAFPTTERSYQTVVKDYPWKCAVEWTDGNSVAQATARVELVDEPPVIQRPWICGTYGVPFMRTQIDLRYADEDHLHYGPCITDPEGDDWTVTSITVQCDSKDEPDTLFYPSIYGIKEFHVDAGSGCDTIDVYPAAIWYPGYTAEIDTVTGLPFSLSTQDGKSGDGDRGYPVLKHFTSPLFRAQNATITITVEDEFGASTTESFIIPIIAYRG